LVGEQKSRVIEAVSTGGGAFVDKAVRSKRLRAAWRWCLDGWLDVAETIAARPPRHGGRWLGAVVAPRRHLPVWKVRWLGRFLTAFWMAVADGPSGSALLRNSSTSAAESLNGAGCSPDDIDALVQLRVLKYIATRSS
jgi:hypothetical protein